MRLLWELRRVEAGNQEICQGFHPWTIGCLSQGLCVQLHDDFTVIVHWIHHSVKPVPYTCSFLCLTCLSHSRPPSETMFSHPKASQPLFPSRVSFEPPSICFPLWRESGAIPIHAPALGDRHSSLIISFFCYFQAVGVFFKINFIEMQFTDNQINSF